MKQISTQVSDEVEATLRAMAAARRISPEQLAAELITRNLTSAPIRPDYVALAKAASQCAGARTVEQIDADIEASRNEW